MKKRKPQRIDLGRGLTGWEYSMGNVYSTRRFDNGDKVYFFNTEWNGHHRRSYTVHVDGDLKEHINSKYRLSVRVSFADDVMIEESFWGRNRKELFQRARKHFKQLREMLRVLPF